MLGGVYMKYISRIQHFLNINRITLEELSEKSNISLLILNNIIDGYIHLDEINFEDMRRISQILKCKIDDLFEFED